MAGSHSPEGSSLPDASLRPPTAHRQHFDYLDGWRGIAIALLLVGHFAPVPGIDFGILGVNFFYVLSGFLMTRILFLQKTPIPTFYKRRMSRIFPAHYVFLVTVVAAFWGLGRTIGWPETAQAAFFVKNYFNLDAKHMPFGHIWSLAVEEHSYLYLSFVAIAHRKGWVKPKVALALSAALCGAIGIVYSFVFTGSELEFGWWEHSEVSAFGILASGTFLVWFDGWRQKTWPWPLYPALILIAVGCHWWSVPLPLRTIGGVGLLALVVNLLHAAPAIVHRALSTRILRQLGEWSFSIYLWQQPLYVEVHAGKLSAPVGLALAIVLGALSFNIVEKPARAALNRSWAKEK